MLALTHHEPDLGLLQQLLLDHTTSPDANLRHLAVICLGHVGRLTGEVRPDVVVRLKELLGDPELGVVLIVSNVRFVSPELLFVLKKWPVYVVLEAEIGVVRLPDAAEVVLRTRSRLLIRPPHLPVTIG